MFCTVLVCTELSRAVTTWREACILSGLGQSLIISETHVACGSVCGLVIAAFTMALHRDVSIG